MFPFLLICTCDIFIVLNSTQLYYTVSITHKEHSKNHLEDKDAKNIYTKYNDKTWIIGVAEGVHMQERSTPPQPE